MSKINGDKKRDNLRSRKQTKMREKMRALRATMNAAPAAKAAAPKAAAPKAAEPKAAEPKAAEPKAAAPKVAAPAPAPKATAESKQPA